LAHERSDRELLAAFVDGDETSFEALMRRHEDRIFALALRITGDRGDALEATQETFISLWRRAESFRGQSEVGTWLYRIGINAARDQVRRRRRFPELAEGAGDDAVDASEGQRSGLDDAVAERIDLARALAALPADYRDAVVMHDLGGLPYEAIATATGVALGTVKSRISRGRRLLARALEQASGPAPSKDLR
jgi:RNA polymerase sigma-70 factor (ECF subfamily)